MLIKVKGGERMARKGQAAMEFLMTYGWAILAAIVVIAVLAIYFRPSTLVSGSTFVTAPFYAVSQSVTTTQVQLEVKNNGGQDVNVTSFALTVKTPNGATCATSNSGIALVAGNQTVLTSGTCSGLTTGNTFNADVKIGYLVSGSTLTQYSTGTISGNTQ